MERISIKFWRKWISLARRFGAVLYLCLGGSTGLSVMCGTRQWITYQSYWSRYSDVDRVSVGSHVTNDDSVRWLYLLCLSLTSKALQIVRHIIIGRWTNICLDARWRLPQQIDFAEQKMEEWSYFHVCSRLSLLFLKRDAKLVNSMTSEYESDISLLIGSPFSLIKGNWGKLMIITKPFFFLPHTHFWKLFQCNICACVFLCWHYVALLNAVVTERCLWMAKFGKWNKAPHDRNAITMATTF